MAKKSDQQIVINIDSGTVLRILLLVVVTMLALGFLRKVGHPLLLLFISFFLALALNPAVSFISAKLKSKSRVMATGAAYLLVLAFLTTFIALVFPPLVKQTADFLKDVPQTIQDFREEDSAINDFISRYNLDEQIDQFNSDIGSRASDLGRPALSTAGKIGSIVADTIIVLVLTFLMLIEGPAWMRRIWAMQPAPKREHRKHLAYKMYRVVTNFVNGQLFIAVLGGIFASIAIFILSQVFDAPVNAIALGGIVGLFALLPLIGTITGAVLVVLACLLVSVPLAIAVAAYFIIYQQIENVTIQPYIQSRTNNLTPLTVLAAALLGVGLGGIMGALLAIPAAGCLKVLFDDYMEQRSIGPVTKKSI